MEFSVQDMEFLLKHNGVSENYIKLMILKVWNIELPENRNETVNQIEEVSENILKK